MSVQRGPNMEFVHEGAGVFPAASSTINADVLPAWNSEMTLAASLSRALDGVRGLWRGRWGSARRENTVYAILPDDDHVNRGGESTVEMRPGFRFDQMKLPVVVVLTGSTPEGLVECARSYLHLSSNKQASAPPRLHVWRLGRPKRI